MNNIPVFLSSDNNYAPYLAVCMASILDNTKSFINFYILDGGISSENKDKIKNLSNKFKNFSIEFLPIDVDKIFANFSVPDRINLATYMRLLIPDLKPELGKVIYIDSDTVVLNDIQNLYNEDIEEYALGAIWNEKRKTFNSDTKEPMNLSDNYKYFNAGVLLIDISKWHKNNIVKDILTLEKQYRNVLPHADESLLNKYFDNNYKILDIKYNYTEWDYTFNIILEKIYIRHFITKLKPWHLSPQKNTSLYHNVEDFWKYAQMTDFYYDILENILSKEEQDKNLHQLQMYNLLIKIDRKNKCKKKVHNA